MTGSTNNTAVAIDGITPLVENVFYGTRDESYPVITGLDARLIETEAQLSAGNYAGMMASLVGQLVTQMLEGYADCRGFAALEELPTRVRGALKSGQPDGPAAGDQRLFVPLGYRVALVVGGQPRCRYRSADIGNLQRCTVELCGHVWHW